MIIDIFIILSAMWSLGFSGLYTVTRLIVSQKKRPTIQAHWPSIGALARTLASISSLNLKPRLYISCHSFNFQSY